MAVAGHPRLVRIADLSDGSEAVVRGTIVPTRDLATSPGGVECVYWELAAERCGGVLFWLTDDSGRALVDPRDASVTARAEYRERVIALATTELADVEERIRVLKRRRGKVAGALAKRDNAERNQLRKLATLLCAIRAQARDNVHVGGTLEGQRRYIAERTTQFAGSNSEAIRLTTAREVTLGAGDEVEVAGFVSVERVPQELATGGYRDLPTCAHLRAPAGGQLRIRGLGDAAPQPEALEAAPEPESASPWAKLIGATVGAAAVIYWVIELLA